MTYSASILRMLDREIAWCKAHPDTVLSREYQDGFIKGLAQAKYLISTANRNLVNLYDHLTLPDAEFEEWLKDES